MPSTGGTDNKEEWYEDGSTVRWMRGGFRIRVQHSLESDYDRLRQVVKLSGARIEYTQ